MTDYDLFGATSGPATSASDGSTEYTLAVEWSIPAGPAWLKGYRFWRAPDGGSPEVTGPVSARTWGVVGEGAVADSDATFTLSGSGWQDVLLATPQPLTPTTRYRSGCLFPNGKFVVTADYWTSGAGGSGITAGPLLGHSNATASSNQQGSLNVGAVIAFPGIGSGTAANYWVTPLVTNVDPDAGVDRELAGTITAAATASGSLSVGRALAGSGSSAGHASGALSVSRSLGGTVSAAAVFQGSLTVTRPGAPGAGWGSLIGIMAADRAVQLEEASATHVDCPVCGGPIDTARGWMNCPMGHWRVPAGEPVGW